MLIIYHNTVVNMDAVSCIKIEESLLQFYLRETKVSFTFHTYQKAVEALELIKFADRTSARSIDVSHLSEVPKPQTKNESVK